jgi:K+-sensing histidine kinase KdpD
MSKCIVHGHGGRIRVENNTRRGRTFCFILPSGATAVTQGRKTAHSHPVARPEVRKK